MVSDQVLVMHCLDAGRKNHSSSKCTVKDMEVEVSRWLVGASNRDGNRKNRLKASEDNA